MRYLIILLIISSLQAKEHSKACDFLFNSYKNERAKSFKGNKPKERDLKTMYSNRANTELNAFWKCTDVNDYNGKYIKKLFDTLKKK